jgi:amino acid permease
MNALKNAIDVNFLLWINIFTSTFGHVHCMHLVIIETIWNFWKQQNSIFRTIRKRILFWIDYIIRIFMHQASSILQRKYFEHIQIKEEM